METTQKFGTHTFNNLPPGWCWRTTPSHGYLHPAHEDNKNVPGVIRAASYEEDCAYAIPVFFNPQLFTQDAWVSAKKTFVNWHPDEYERITGTEVKRGESTIKDNYYFMRIDNIGKIEATCAFGDWCYMVPPGFVYFVGYEIRAEDACMNVFKPKGDERKEFFLVRKEIYNTLNVFPRSILIPYRRPEEYYTWEDYTAKTGLGQEDIFPAGFLPEAAFIKHGGLTV